MLWMVAAGLGVACIGGVVGPPGVSRRGLPSGRLIEDLLDGADYVDCYSVNTRHGLAIVDVDRAAIQRGRLVDRSSREIVYSDRAPGLRFVVGYFLAERRLEITTVVHYLNGTGRLYFAIVRPVHRVLVPWLIWSTARRAERVR